MLMHRVPDRLTPLIAKLLLLCLSTDDQTLKPLIFFETDQLNVDYLNTACHAGLIKKTGSSVQQPWVQTGSYFE